MNDLVLLAADALRAVVACWAHDEMRVDGHVQADEIELPDADPK